MDILLAGASGFVGRNFILQAPRDWRIVALYFNDSGFPDFVSCLNNSNVRTARCDLTQPEQVSALVRDHGSEWETCLYLAGKVDIPWSVKNPKDDLLLNAGSLLNLLEHVRCGKFIYFSSGAVYDGLKGEVSPHDPISPTLPYAVSKLACERYVHCYRERRRSIERCLVVRFFGAYGPYEASHKIYTRLIRAFSLERKDTYTIYGNGQNLIDAMYVDDAVDAIQRMLTGTHWDDTINLASGHPVTIETLVRQAGEALGLSSVRVEKEGIANENIEFWASTSQMQKHFGFQPKITLSQGIVRLRDFLLADGSKAALQSPHQ